MTVGLSALGFTCKLISLLIAFSLPFISVNFRKKNDTNVKDIKELKDRYQIIDKANQFIIAVPEVYDAGKYSCSIPNLEEAEINVVGKCQMANK